MTKKSPPAEQDPAVIPAPAAVTPTAGAAPLPQQGGSYTRHPDGTLTLNTEET